MAIEWRNKQDGGRVLHLSGSIDFTQHRGLSSATSHLQSEMARLPVEADLSGVTMLDSAGLGLLLILKERVEQKGLRVVLTRCSPVALDSLRDANFNRVFEIS